MWNWHKIFRNNPFKTFGPLPFSVSCFFFSNLLSIVFRLPSSSVDEPKKSRQNAHNPLKLIHLVALLLQLGLLDRLRLMGANQRAIPAGPVAVVQRHLLGTEAHLQFGVAQSTLEAVLVDWNGLGEMHGIGTFFTNGKTHWSPSQPQICPDAAPASRRWRSPQSGGPGRCRTRTCLWIINCL